MSKYPAPKEFTNFLSNPHNLHMNLHEISRGWGTSASAKLVKVTTDPRAAAESGPRELAQKSRCSSWNAVFLAGQDDIFIFLEI